MQDNLAARMAHLTRFVGLPGIRNRQDGLNRGEEVGRVFSG
jgi:hypothetical protein